MTKTPNLGLKLIQPNQAQKEITANEAFSLIDGLLNNSIKAINVNDTPDLPEIGDLYQIGTNPTGDWSGYRGQMALYSLGGWRYFTPKEGLLLWCTELQKILVYLNGAWLQY